MLNNYFMPRRQTVFANGEYYHVFNRSINRESIFVSRRNCLRALDTFTYYRFENPPIRLSYYLVSSLDKKQEIMDTLNQREKKYVEIITFCLMPNHFHLLLRQELESGISKFLSLLQNSYTRYFNTDHSRQGHLFQGQFKSVRIETDEQLLHVNRYIHLNPYTSYVVKNFGGLEDYQFSSLPEYLSTINDGICITNEILSHFSSTKMYKKFVLDQVDYQRSLDKIKHFVLEKG